MAPTDPTANKVSTRRQPVYKPRWTRTWHFFCLPSCWKPNAVFIPISECGGKWRTLKTYGSNYACRHTRTVKKHRWYKPTSPGFTSNLFLVSVLLLELLQVTYCRRCLHNILLQDDCSMVCSAVSLVLCLFLRIIKQRDSFQHLKAYTTFYCFS